MTGELDPLIRSFAGEPELHHPVRGRIKRARAFEAYFDEMQAMVDNGLLKPMPLHDHAVDILDRDDALAELDGDAGRVGLPVAVVANKAPTDGSTSCGCTTAAGR